MTYRTARRALACCLAFSLPFILDAAPGGGASVGHSALLMADGTIWTAGHNYNGEVGDNTTQPRRYRVSVLSGATSVAVGFRHTLAAAGGTAYAWGRGIDGQLCDDLAIAHHLPTPVPGLTGVVQVAAANFSSFFVLADGTVRSCGGNENGILADGTETARHLPVSVAGITDASAIAAGPEHVLVLRATGTVLAWGKNTHGRLGDGTTTDRQVPVAVSGLTNVVAVAAGRDFSMALDASGQVWVWGLGFYGISGDGTTSDHLTPFQVPGLTNVTQIAAGRFHAAVVDGNQQVRTWGGGLLGHGSTQWLSVPTVVAGLQPIAMVAAGGDSTFAFAVDGGVYGWGDNAHGLLGDGTDAIRLSPIVLADGGGVWRTGTPVFGPSGGTYATEQTVQITSATPGAVVRYTTTGSDPTESDPQVPIGGLLVDQNRTLKARAWTAGREPSYVAAATFTLQPASPAVAPGTGSYTASQTVTIATSTPGAVIRYTLDGSVPTAASPPYGGPLAISTGTTLSAKAFKAGWAESALRIATYSFNYGTLGTPVLSPGGGTYGADQTVSIAVPDGPSGTVVRYTTNGSTPGTSSPIYTGPVTVASPQTLKARAFHPDWTPSATATGTYAFTADTPTFTRASGTYPAGEVVAIAANTPNATIRYTLNGLQPTANDPVYLPGTTLTLGDYTLTAAVWKTGYTTSAPATATYRITGDVTPAQIRTGETHTLVVARDGSVWSFGSNGWGHLGDGSTTSRSQPVRVAGLTAIKDVAGGAQHSLAVGLDGRVYSWGANSSGQQGDGSTLGYRTMPVPVAAVTNATAVAAGQNHSLALTNTGQVYAWGANSNGQLGLGTTATQPTPTLIPGLSGIVGIAAGNAHSFAWTTSGALYAWGSNTSGKLGDGTTTQRTSPVLIAGISGVAGVAAGANHTLARTTSAQVWAWGRNAEGQLGDSTTTNRSVPTLVTTLSSVQAIGAGANHSLASTATTTYGWGANASSQVGDGFTANRSTPTATAFGAAVQLAGGTVHSVGLDAAGSVWTWGGGSAGQLGNGGTTTQGIPGPISGGGQTWGVAAPVVTPGTGTYDVEQTVAVTSPTPGATVRYTTTGSDPVETDPIASGPIAITQTATLKAKAWKGTLSPSPVTAAVYTLQPVTPTASPGGGTFSSPQTVTLATTSSGATIRYTLDGSEPHASSTAYSTPLSIATTVTLKAAALKPGWSPSPTLTHAYTIVADLRPPTITARIRPGVNAAGWTMGPAEVSFRCHDFEGPVQDCPVPLAVPQETAGVPYTGTVTDQVGRVATVSGVVRVDDTPPVVTLTGPADGVEVSTPTVTLTGTATDALSGLASVRCNAVTATVSNGIVTCEVPLRPGRNPVVLQASDVAGHSTSVGIVVWRTAVLDRLTLSPEQATLHQGDEMPLRLVNNMGREQTGATWTVSDPAIAEVDETATPTLRALAPGTATVTASVGAFSAQTTVTVVGTTVVLVPGTTRWMVQVTPGFTLEEVIYTHQTSPDVPEAVLVESVGGEHVQLRGVTDGITTSITPVAGGLPGQTMGDSFGGVLLVLSDGEHTALQRVGFTSGVAPWRWVSAGDLSGIVQTHDGTIFATERVSDGQGTVTAASVVVLDGATGSLRSRVAITTSTYVNTWHSDGWTNCQGEEPQVREGVGATGLWALTTADVYGVVTVEEDHVSANCPEGGGTVTGHAIGAQHLLTVDRNGASTIEQLSQYSQTFPSTQGGLSTPPATKLTSDARGNFVVTFNSDERQLFGPTPSGPALSLGDGVIVSATGIHVAREGAGLHARNLSTGGTVWLAADDATPIAFAPEGRHAAIVSDGSIFRESGPEAMPGALDLSSIPIASSLRYGLDNNVEYASLGGFVSIRGLDAFGAAISGEQRNDQGQGSSRKPEFGLFLKGHAVFGGYYHASLWLVPTNQSYWRQQFPNIFTNRDSAGSYYATLGAGPEGSNIPCEGKLVSHPNRPRDVNVPASDFAKLGSLPANEDALIGLLFTLDATYADDLDYDCFPGPSSSYYNSNSFASGLLKAAEITSSPDFVIRKAQTYPGWLKPVPAAKFGVP